VIFLTYGKYKDLRGAAWQCLIDNQIDRLPVNILQIAKNNGIRVIKNSDAHQLAPNESGISINNGPKWYIIYDDSASVERSRFTVAHELGHIFLGHKLVKGKIARTKTFATRPEIEREADMFASRLLCPACVLWALDLHAPEEISQACKVSYTSAKIRAERMELLYTRNKFLTHPLEREVYQLFQDYIRDHSH